MSSIQVDLAFLEQLASRIECLVYAAEHLHGPRVFSTFPLLDLDPQSPFRQSVEAEYQQWQQVTESVIGRGKELSQHLRQTICRFEQIEWPPVPLRQEVEAASEVAGEAGSNRKERTTRCARSV